MLPFDLPPLDEHGPTPQWTGSGFLVGTETVPVLEYSENFCGWSDELTDLHEEAVNDGHPIDQASFADALEQVRRYAPGGKSVVLEIGCSSGYMLRKLRAEARPGMVVIGSDIVKAPLYRLAAELPEIPLLRFDLLQCPLPDDCVDIVIMLNVLEHIERDDLALEQVRRILKPGGVLILEVPAGSRNYDAYDKALRHFRRYDAAGLGRQIEKAGLRLLRRSHLGFFIYPAFALVKLWNRSSTLTEGEGLQLVKQQASYTASSRGIRAAFRLEQWIGRCLSFPFGVRCLMVAQK